MGIQLLITWLPLAMVVGLGARFLGRGASRGLGGLIVACWVLLSMLSGAMDLQGPAIGVAMAAGALALILFAVPRNASKDGRNSISTLNRQSGLSSASHAKRDLVASISADKNAESSVDSIVKVAGEFDQWLSTHRELADPWPDFGEFVRVAVHRCFGATQIKAYRLLSKDDSTFLPLHETAPKEFDFPPLRSGIRGHVATSGSNFYGDDQNDSVRELTGTSDESCAWCFGIRMHGAPIGVIQVGQLDDTVRAERHHLQMMECVISLCWMALTEACRSRLASTIDSVAGVLTSEAFLSVAGSDMSELYAKSEPVSIASFNVEGLRRLTDQGKWERAKDAIRRASEIIRDRTREDDHAGFFDGSRFIVMLARVDCELATLISQKIQRYIADMFKTIGEPNEQLGIRCGLASSGEDQASLHVLISQASAVAAEARRQGRDLMAFADVADEVVSQ